MAAALAGCGGGEDDPPEMATAWRSATVRNDGPGEARLGLRINGRELFANDADVLSIVMATSQADGAELSTHPGRRFALALWRFLVANRYHYDPLTAERWAHAPVLLLNSLGFGYCDDVSAAFASLARQAGYPARVWSLTGHVVPEIWIGDRWEMYDPDLVVYYLDAQGLPCSVEALSADSTLITSPRISSAPAWAIELNALNGHVASADIRYSSEAAYVFGSVADNSINGWYDDIPYTPPPGPPVTLPAGATLMLGLRTDPFVVTCYGEPLSRQGALQLSLPAGWAGVVDMPLVPLRIDGVGLVRIDETQFGVDSPSLRERLLAFEEPVQAIEVLQSGTALTVEFLLSDKRFDLQTLHRVETTAGGESIATAYSPMPLA